MMYYIKKEVKTMKKNKIYIFIAVLFAAFFSACSEDDLSSESVITEAQRVEKRLRSLDCEKLCDAL